MTIEYVKHHGKDARLVVVDSPYGFLRCVFDEGGVKEIRTEVREKRVNRGVCAFRSKEHLYKKECASCGGGTQVKVFACEKHERCTVKKPIDGEAVRESCSDFKETSQTE